MDTKAAEPTKAELQEQARKAGLPTSGTKEELAERLAEAEATTVPGSPESRGTPVMRWDGATSQVVPRD